MPRPLIIRESSRPARAPGLLLALLLTPARLLALLLPLAMSLTLTGCEESLPAYEAPDTPLAAEIIIESRLDSLDVADLSPDFSVTVTNTSEFIDGWALHVPWSVSVNISVFLASDPGRHIHLSTRRTFNNPIDDLVHGYYVIIGFDLPLRDSEGRAWNWGDEEAEAIDIILQGRVRIGRLDLEINMPRVTTSLQFSTP